MIRKNRLKTLVLSAALLLLIPTSLSLCFPQLGKGVGEVEANPFVSHEWSYSGWQYREEHNITRNQIDDGIFYDISDSWTTISGNPTDRHTFQPVHKATIVEVNKIVDGAPRKYLAYDSDDSGSQIRLYYTDNLDGTWTPYSQNPILGLSVNHFRWPSVAYVNGIFHMFLSDVSDVTLERWTSTDGISFMFQENVKTGGEPFRNPFIWHNPNDAKWYLYTHDASEGKEYIKVRNASSIEDLDLANDAIVLSQTIPFGSPSVIYHENKYLLLAEILQGEVWKVVAYRSTTSPSSGFSECLNSPILSDDEACPILLLTPDQVKAYLFTNMDSSKWYQDTREVYLDKTTSETPSLVEYQMKITAYYENGTDNGDKVYLNGHSRTDFGDVRFTWFNSSSGDEVECDYWIEELKTNESAVFWVKIPEISSTINNTIYLYYGKSDATTTSNGEATFDFFDDFNGDLTKWTLLGGTWQIENGELSAQTTTYGQRIRANNFLFKNNSVHVKVKWITGTYFEHGPYVRGQWPNEQYFGYMTFPSTWNGDQSHRISKITGGPYGTTIISQGTTNPSKDIWYNIVFKLYGNRLKSSISPLYYTEISGTDSSLSNGSLCLFSWSSSNEHVHFDDLFVSKYVEPEPTHADWASEEISTYVVVDQAFLSDERADVYSFQTVGLHAKWSDNGSDVVGGSIYVNNTEYISNSTGWVAFNVNSSFVGKDVWVVTGVNCNGVTSYMQTAQAPSIVWDQIKIIEGDTTRESLTLGETATIWFKAIYEYDNTVFTSANGILYLNGSAMTWFATNTRWEYTFTATTMGSLVFAISGVNDESYGLTMLNDTVGAQTINVWSTPFSVISNSTITELTFNSTSKTLAFTVSGPTGTTGYTNVTIAKTLVANTTDLKVYLDGSPLEYSTNSTTDSWIIEFTYGHSTHRIVIALNSMTETTPTAYPTTYILLALLIATLILATVIKKKKHTYITHQKHANSQGQTKLLFTR